MCVENFQSRPYSAPPRGFFQFACISGAGAAWVEKSQCVSYLAQAAPHKRLGRKYVALRGESNRMFFLPRFKKLLGPRAMRDVNEKPQASFPRVVTKINYYR